MLPVHCQTDETIKLANEDKPHEF